MHIVFYKKSSHTELEKQILDRAAYKKHLLKKLLLWDILLFAALGILGPLLHFTSSLFQALPFLQLIAPVNESIWEHLKLLFFPAVFVAFLRRLFTGKLQHGILTTFAEGILLSMALMVTAFYTYSGILGTHDMQVDVFLFYLLSLFLTIYVHFRSFRQKKSSLPGLIILLLLAGCFFYFTSYPPNLGIFSDITQPLQ